MKLKEPKKKNRNKRVNLQRRSSLPLTTSENGQWQVYTAHLSASGTCIVDPLEMEAVYSMGFFGKGSLSKSFPTFNRRRIGVPPIARNRQWVRRQKWLDELQTLNETDPDRLIGDKATDGDEANASIHEGSGGGNDVEASTSKASSKSEESALSRTETKSEEKSESIPNEPCEKKLKVDHEPLIDEKAIEVKKTANEEGISKTDESQSSTSMVCDKTANSDENRTDSPSINVDEVILDSTEDEDICEIQEKGLNNEKDVYFLNERGKSDNDFKYREISETLIDEGSDPFDVLVLPDTDSDTENYLTNVKSRIEKAGFPINETLHLTFEETFFLMYGLGCLQLIHYDGSVLSINNAWNHFQLQDKYFIQKYIVYHYFRSKGWVVKPGLKFGGDFLLYKEGPPFYHASYIVIVEVLDADTLLRVEGKSMRKLTWKNLIGLERLSETIAKEILFAQILWPSLVPRNDSQMPVDALSEFTVRELLWRRWDPKRKRESVYIDEDDGHDDDDLDVIDDDGDDDDDDDDDDNNGCEDDDDNNYRDDDNYNKDNDVDEDINGVVENNDNGVNSGSK